MSRIAIGVGCRKGCSGKVIEGLVQEALSRLPSFPRRRESIAGQHDVEELDSRLRGNDDLYEVLGLFTLADKEDEAGLHAAANRLGVDLTFLSRDSLRAVADRVQSSALHAQAAFGVPSVAEASALAGAGPEAVLLVPRIADGGATCAIAGDAT